MSRIKTEATGAGQPECLRHDSHHTGGPEPSRGSPTPPGCRLTPGPGSHLLLGPEGGQSHKQKWREKQDGESRAGGSGPSSAGPGCSPETHP